VAARSTFLRTKGLQNIVKLERGQRQKRDLRLKRDERKRKKTDFANSTKTL